MARCTDVSSIVILADGDDLLAIRVAAALRRDRCPVTVLTSTQLSLGCEWTHRLTGATVTTHVRLRADHADVIPSAVLNRLPASRFFPAQPWSSAADAAYAEAEFSALLASWLASLRCVVLGPPRGGLLGQPRGLCEWLALARAAGLPVQAVTLANDATAVDRRGMLVLDPFEPGRPLSKTEAYVIGRNPVLLSEPLADLRSVYVVGGQIIDLPEDDLAPALVRLGDQTGCSLLECRFGRASAGRWVFCGASSAPHNGPAALVGAISTLLAAAAQVAA